MDPSILKKTQDTLGKAIKKPPLTDKLLNKPPFRFLHDILTEVIKTGVLKGLYSDHELNSSNVSVSKFRMFFAMTIIMIFCNVFSRITVCVSLCQKDYIIFSYFYFV